MSDNIIREAAENIRGNWYQGALSNAPEDGVNGDGTKMCAVGHLRAVQGGERGWLTEATPAIVLLNEVAREQFPERLSDGLDSLVIFNDHKDTTEDDVIMVFEKAAVRWDEQI